ncbi:MAG: hypothetical protein QF436_03120 [Candidatus Woesearchaeota archaeon]|nr:hypothetical protein [Candidatus Woesearchaeota archaeon]MDP7623080.1 hypothetical protein [Candidatus Woesearchaeota archaeon]
MVNILILIALGLLTFFILSAINIKLFGKSAKETSGLLDSTKDYDDDGVTNFFDNCVCIAGDEDNKGCPINEVDVEEMSAKEKREWKNKECPDV